MSYGQRMMGELEDISRLPRLPFTTHHTRPCIYDMNGNLAAGGLECLVMEVEVPKSKHALGCRPGGALYPCYGENDPPATAPPLSPEKQRNRVVVIGLAVLGLYGAWRLSR